MANPDQFVVNVDNNLFELDANDIETLDLIKEGNDTFHCIVNNQNFVIQMLAKDFVNKILTLKINGNIHQISIKDQFDLLIDKMGLMSSKTVDVKEIHAPMPGLVLNLQVGLSQNVIKGDTLLVLEAMKMENIIKSPVDGIVKAIYVTSGEPVDKGQLLIEFE